MAAIWMARTRINPARIYELCGFFANFVLNQDVFCAFLRSAMIPRGENGYYLRTLDGIAGKMGHDRPSQPRVTRVSSGAPEPAAWCAPVLFVFRCRQTACSILCARAMP